LHVTRELGRAVEILLQRCMLMYLGSVSNCRYDDDYTEGGSWDTLPRFRDLFVF